MFRHRTLRACLELIRPPNTLTAFADVLAGAAVAGGFAVSFAEGTAVATGTLGWLLAASACLYAGGITFNDVCDAGLDARERPERPIPSGRISRRGAALWGGGLLTGGIALAATAGGASAWIAAGIAGGALLYNARAKHHALAGPVVMGACRGGNLLLGISSSPALLAPWWPLALLPVPYIAAVTTLSRGEVHGGGHRSGTVSLALLLAVMAVPPILAAASEHYRILDALPFLLLLAALVVPPVLGALRDPAPSNIGKAVKAGVLSLIVLNAALAAGFAGWQTGLVVLTLLPVSRLLARRFAVT